MKTSVNAVQKLSQEHQQALKSLRELQQAVKFMQGGKIQENNWDTAASFSEMADHVLRRHFQNEEKAVFPVLGEIIGIETAPIARLREEHQILHEAFDHLEEGIAAREAAVIIHYTNEIGGILPGHFAKEEEELYQEIFRLLQPWQVEEINLKIE